MEILALFAIVFYLGGFCLIPILMIGFFILLISLSRKNAREQEAIWGEFAAQMGLTLQPGSFFKRPSVWGVRNGRQVRLASLTTGTSGHGRTVYTVISLSVNNPKGIDLTIGEESLFRQVASLMLSENSRIGIPAFDERFRLQSQPPEAARHILLQDNLHARLLQTRSLRIALKGAELRYQQVGVEMDKSRLRFLFDVLDDLAAAIENI